MGKRSKLHLDSARPVNRRIKACLQCQKQKVRCSLPENKAPCKRCAVKDIPCLFKRDLLQAKSIDHRLLTSFVNDTHMLYEAVNQLRAAGGFLNLPPLQLSSALTELAVDAKSPQSVYDSSTPSFGSVDINADLIDKQPATSTLHEVTAAQTPINSLHEITRLPTLHSQQSPVDDVITSKREQNDLIARNVLTITDAEILVKRYQERMDHYLYGIARNYVCLNDLRKSSQLLLTAILTVSALQNADSSNLYRVCYVELQNLIAEFVFAPTVDLEDIRGLCISSFWLSGISWSISSLAIRRAVEMGLHESLGVAVDGLLQDQRRSACDAQTNRQVEGARLWYMLCICDQHLAILYGRPSILQGDEGTQHWTSYLALTGSSATDVRILGQVALLQILRALSETFGQDSSCRVATLLRPQLETFNRKIDRWATHWLSITQDHSAIGSYPTKAIMLHYHFSKLLVSSHVFRGLGLDSSQDPMPNEFDELAYVAISSAKSVVELTVTDPDIVAAFATMPHYYHTMIAFASLFLFKAAAIYRHGDMDSTLMSSLVKPVIELCLNTNCGNDHLVCRIGRGLEILMQSYTNFLEQDRPPAQLSCHKAQSGTEATSSPVHHGCVANQPANIPAVTMGHLENGTWEQVPSSIMSHTPSMPLLATDEAGLTTQHGVFSLDLINWLEL